MSARIVALQLHTTHGQPLRAVNQVRGVNGAGLEGDSHADKSKRGVVVVDRSTLDDLGLDLGDLREQITIEGLRGVTTLAPGTELAVGELVLRVNGPCEPCTHIGEMLGVPDVEEFQRSLEGRRGAICTVVRSGVARVGDAVAIVTAEVAH